MFSHSIFSSVFVSFWNMHLFFQKNEQLTCKISAYGFICSKYLKRRKLFGENFFVLPRRVSFYSRRKEQKWRGADYWILQNRTKIENRTLVALSHCPFNVIIFGEDLLFFTFCIVLESSVQMLTSWSEIIGIIIQIKKASYWYILIVHKYRLNGTMDDFERVRELGKGSFGSAILGKW